MNQRLELSNQNIRVINIRGERRRKNHKISGDVGPSINLSTARGNRQ